MEAERYILKGVSGKDSVRSKEFLRLFDDIQSGRINTVLCTALDRICRSVRDFLCFFEYLNTHNVEFVCLKESYDTTSPQGKLLITFMMALAEFEREQTSARVKEATFARAKRGLWNGGHILGYDLDVDRKGYIVPNEKEKILVNFTYDTYLKQGSILSTAKVMNSNGHRTKVYTANAGKYHPPKEFSYSSIKNILTNYTYIGKKEIFKKAKNKDQSKLSENERYQIVDAVWEPIVDEEKFWAVQDLMEKNCQTKHNQVRPIKHNYILNSGLLWCEKCGEEMQGRSGTRKLGKKYNYYICKNIDCKFKVPADEIEKVIIEQIKMLSSQDEIIANILKGTNNRLQKELPQLKEQKSSCKGSLMRFETLLMES